VSARDVPALWALWREPAVRRFLWDDRVIVRAEAEATVAECIALAPRGLGLWALWAAPRSARGARGREGAAPARRFVGCAGLLPVSTAAEFEPRLAGLVEPLVALHPAAWGRGYATEALGALLQHARVALGLRVLAGVTDVPNEASDRMLRRAGFVPLSEVAGPRHRLRTLLYTGEPAAPTTT
jgi:RimJ/RimL family protein N-acetyltransferase